MYVHSYLEKECHIPKQCLLETDPVWRKLQITAVITDLQKQTIFEFMRHEHKSMNCIL